MESNFDETPVIPEPEETQSTGALGSFTSKLNLEDRSKALMEAGTNVWEKMKALPKKVWAMIGAGAAVLAVVIVILCLLSNTYKTPLTLTTKLLNAKKFDKVLTLAPNSLNGFCESEVKAIIKLLKKTDAYKENIEDFEDDFAEVIDGIKDEYGSNYKISYKITSKDKIDKDDCKDYQDTLKTLGKSLLNSLEEVDDYDSDDWEDMSDDMGLSKSDCKKLAKEMKSIGKNLRQAKVTAGYELEVTVMLKGRELDEPLETDLTVNVYKINGRWVLDYIGLVKTALKIFGLSGMSNISGLLNGF